MEANKGLQRHTKSLNLHSDRDQIIHYLLDPNEGVELSPALQQKVDRIYACGDLIRTWGSRLKVLPILEKRYNISRKTAESIFEDTQLVLGATQKSTQQFWVDVVMGEIIEDKRKAMFDKDWRAVAAMQKNMITVVQKLMGSIDVTIYEKINPPPIKVGFYPEQLKVKLPSDEDLKRIFAKLQEKKRQKLFQDISEDADIVS